MIYRIKKYYGSAEVTEYNCQQLSGVQKLKLKMLHKLLMLFRNVAS